MIKEIIKDRFGGSNLEARYAGFNNSKVAILPCPYERTVTYGKGCSKGPHAILKASSNIELFDDELKAETYRIGIYTNPPLPLSKLTPKAMVENIRRETSKILNSEKLPVVIGGEHTVSIGAVSAVNDRYKNMSILQLDAHYDLRNDYDGLTYNHACVGRRFLEFCPVVQVGMRSLCKEEQDFLNTDPPDLKTIDAYSIIYGKSDWKKKLCKFLTKNVYISIDMDVLDPSFMPSVGTPEPGGLGWYIILDLLKIVATDRKIIGFDIVELMPIKEIAAPDFLAAKLLYRILGYIFHGSESLKVKNQKSPPKADPLQAEKVKSFEF